MPAKPVNCSATKNGCEKKRSILRRPADDDLVVLGELVDAENRDDVLQVLVALQDLCTRRDTSVVLSPRISAVTMRDEVEASGSTAGRCPFGDRALEVRSSRRDG